MYIKKQKIFELCYYEKTTCNEYNKAQKAEQVQVSVI